MRTYSGSIRQLVATCIAERVMTGDAGPLHVVIGAVDGLNIVAAACDND